MFLLMPKYCGIPNWLPASKNWTRVNKLSLSLSNIRVFVANIEATTGLAVEFVLGKDVQRAHILIAQFQRVRGAFA